MHAVESLEKWRRSKRELSEHPDYPVESWVQAVNGGQTALDYWDWMLSQAEKSDHKAQETAAKAAEERTDQLMVEGNLFYFVNGSTDYAEVIGAAPFFVVPVIKGYDYSAAPFPLQIVTSVNLCKLIEQSPRMEAGAILYGYGANSLEDANLILKRLRRYEQESALYRKEALKFQRWECLRSWAEAGRILLMAPLWLLELFFVLLPFVWIVAVIGLLVSPFVSGCRQ